MIAAAGLVAALVAFGFGLGAHASPWPLVFFALLAIVAERESVRLSGTTQLSVAFLPLLFVAVVFGPLAAAVVGALALVADIRRPYVRWLTWTATRTLVTGAAGLVAYAGWQLGGSTPTRVLVATLAAAAVDFGLDVVLAATTLALRATGSAREIIRTTAPMAAAGLPLYTFLVGMFAYAYVALTPWSAAVFFLPGLAAQRLFLLYRDQRESAQDLAEAVQELRRANEQLAGANLSFATALVATLEARDRYTAGHSATVAIYARDIARELGLSGEEQTLAHLCGLVHDIGKIGLPSGVLEKPGSLTPTERREMEQHSLIGEQILANVSSYEQVATTVRHHHEQVDGTGYPDGISGTAIPIASRIIAVADAYDAMTSDRPYRDALPAQVARARLADGSTTQFDPDVVAAFARVLSQKGDRYPAGRRAGLWPRASAAPPGPATPLAARA